MVRQVLAHYGYSPTDIVRFSDTVHRDVYQPFRLNRDPGEGLQALASLPQRGQSDRDRMGLGAGDVADRRHHHRRG